MDRFLKITALLLTCCIMTLSLVLIFGDTGEKQADPAEKTTDVTMPDLVGMDFQQAEQVYTTLNIKINGTEHSDREKDTILEQDVAPGTPISEGQPIYVIVSLGAQTSVVPDVRGLDYEDAETLLAKAGFAVGEKYESTSDGTAESTVLRTVPAAGTEAVLGSAVIVYISRAQVTDAVTIPELVGMNIQDATTLCEYYGLKVEEVPVVDGETEEYCVISQSITQGEQVDAGTTIWLFYSEGPGVDFQLNIPEGTQGSFILDFVNEGGGKAYEIIFTPTSEITANGVDRRIYSVPCSSLGTNSHNLRVYLVNEENGRNAKLGSYYYDSKARTLNVLEEDQTGAFRNVGALPE